MNKQVFKRRRRDIFLRFKTIAFVICIITLPIKPIFAQVFPVQAYINVTPPYSVYLSQYTASDQEKIMTTILLRDPVITSIDVKFRFTIQSSGIKLTTNPSWNPAPYNLVSGVSVILPQDIIADYLKPQHLLIEGIDQQEFYRSGKLPEGYYQFKVEVIEYRRNITISNTAQAGLWLMLNEPPRIVFPLPNQKVTATNPQMLNFTWVPGGVSSPQSSLTTQYEFTLVELTDSNVDPYIAIITASNATKYVKTLDQTSLFYGPGEMLLTPGKSYAIRVRAYTTDGFDMFKNNGYSDVRVFTFGDACTPPVSFSLQNPNQNSFEVSVMSSPTNTAWQARFRESSITDGLWSELKSEPGADAKTIKGLKASTSYDVQVKGLCGDIPSDYSQTQTIQTTEMVNANRSCSGSVSPFAVKDAQSLTNLKAGDVFFAALFPVRVKGIKSQGGGRFSGYGIATLPLFNTGLAVTFDNVGINDLMQLTSGEVKVIRDEFNITLFGDSQTTTTTTTTGGGTGGPNGGATYPPITDTITIPSDYDSIRIVDNNTILVYTPTGTQTYTVSLGSNSSTLVVPADHNMDNAKLIYDGAVHPYPQGQGNTMNIEPKNFTGFIAYFKDKMQLHGFDTLNPKISVLSKYYNQLPVAGNQFYVPWKALKVDQPEPIDLLIKQGTDKLPFSNLKVKQQNIGDITPSTGAGTQNQTFLVKGSYNGAEDNVIAYYNADGKEQIAGGIYLATYGEERFKLILVPFPGVNISDVRGSLSYNLSAIYSQAVVSWSVDTLAGFPGIDLGSNGLDWADKDMLSSYNSEMNSTISAFKDWKANPDPNAYYLFVVPSFSQTDVEGYMPRNRRFGFVTKDQLDARTIAHELGHGAFNLHHTFSTNGWAIEQNSTDNLMDYNNGNKLWKPQWDLIHNPEATTGLFDGMDEGASQLISDPDFVTKFLNDFRIAYITSKRFFVKADGWPYIGHRANDIKFDSTKFNSISIQIKKTDSLSVISKPNSYITTRIGLSGDIYAVHSVGTVEIEVEKENFYKLVDYMYPTMSKLIVEIQNALKDSVLSPIEIANVREKIATIDDSDLKKYYYLTLQEKVPYHNQRNNGQEQSISDIMCNLTSESMCLEYLGISCPNPNMQFEDYLEQVRKENNYGDRTLPSSRKKIAVLLGACYSNQSYSGTFSERKESLIKFILPKLQSGCAVMLGIWPSCKGHLVRVQNITDDGIIVDDPYGKVKGKTDGFDWREACKSGGYELNSTTKEDNKGNNNLWEWTDINDATVVVVDVYCKCK